MKKIKLDDWFYVNEVAILKLDEFGYPDETRTCYIKSYKDEKYECQIRTSGDIFHSKRENILRAVNINNWLEPRKLEKL